MSGNVTCRQKGLNVICMVRTYCLTALLFLATSGLDPLNAAGRDPDAYNPFDIEQMKRVQKGIDDARIQRPDTGRNAENNPDRYETYQDCYVNTISDVGGIPAAAGDERQAAVKEYCRAVFTVTQRKAFTDCFTSWLGKGTPVDEISRECKAASTPVK